MFNFKKEKRRTRADPVAFFLGGGDLVFDGYITLDQNEEVKRCIHKVSDIVSNMTLMLMANGESGDMRIKNELSKKIDVYPNADMTRKQFIYSIVQEMMSTGNAIVLPEVNRDAYISNLEIIPHGKYSFIPYKNSYKIRIDGKVFDPDEVLHFVLIPSLSQPWRGAGYAGMFMNTLKNIAQANHTKRGFLQSKWKPSIIISVETDENGMIEPEFRKTLLESYTSDMEDGNPWLIPADEIKIDKIQPLTLQDLAVQESLTLDIQTVSACIGIPGFMVGTGKFDKDEYNNFIATTVMSFAQILQQEFSKKLIVSPDMYIKCNSRSLMQYSLSEKVGFVKEMIGGGLLNRNEGRNEFDYSPVDDEGMNGYTVLENYLQVKDLGKQKKLIQGGDEDE